MFKLTATYNIHDLAAIDNYREAVFPKTQRLP
jgi:hypothetical protein